MLDTVVTPGKQQRQVFEVRELRDAFHTRPLNPLLLTLRNPSGPHSTPSLCSTGASGVSGRWSIDVEHDK